MTRKNDGKSARLDAANARCARDAHLSSRRRALLDAEAEAEKLRQEGVNCYAEEAADGTARIVEGEPPTRSTGEGQRRGEGIHGAYPQDAEVRASRASIADAREVLDRGE